MTYTARTPIGAILTVRPMHWSLYLLGLGPRLSPIGLGRVVTLADPDRPDEPYYTGDGPSLGWVTERLLFAYIAHDHDYRWAHYRAADYRRDADERARTFVRNSGAPSLARYRLAWRLATPLLVLAWRYRWGGWNDLPRWLWWPVLAAWAALVWGVPVGALALALT